MICLHVCFIKVSIILIQLWADALAKVSNDKSVFLGGSPAIKFVFFSDRSTHAFFRSSIGCKVALGYDLVGDAYTGAADSIPHPDNDPLDACGANSGASGHGTHVSGIVAADDHKYVNTLKSVVIVSLMQYLLTTRLLPPMN